MRTARRSPPSTAWSLACLLWLALARGASGGLQPVLKLDSKGGAVRPLSYTEGSPPVALTANLTLLAAGSPCITAVVRIPRAGRARHANLTAAAFAGANHKPGERAARNAGGGCRIQAGRSARMLW